MTTTEPSLAKQIYEAATAKGADAVDAPVSGGDVGARNATLSIMIGGDKPTVDGLMPLFETMGKRILYQGGPGAGQHTKMCNQIMIAGTMIGMCEALLYGHKAGLNLDTMVETIRGGAAGCWSLDNSRRASSNAISRRDSSSIISSRTWGSRWPKPIG